MEDLDIILEVDGKKIPMNEFVRKMLGGVITGSISALRGVDEEWKVINIRLKR